MCNLMQLRYKVDQLQSFSLTYLSLPFSLSLYIYIFFFFLCLPLFLSLYVSHAASLVID